MSVFAIRTGQLLVLLSLMGVVAAGCDRSPVSGEGEQEKSVSAPAVATVNNEEITVADLEQYLADRPPGSGVMNTQALQKRLQELVTTTVLAQESKKKGIDRKPSVKLALQQLLSQHLLEQEVVIPVTTRQVGRDEIEAFYQKHINEYIRPRQIRLADIFIAVPDNSPPEVWQEKQNRAEKILALALQDEGKRFNFSFLIRKYSDTHPLFGKGDTGYFDAQGKPLGLDPEYVHGAFALKDKGKVYPQLVHTPHGYHIIMLVATRSGKEKKLSDLTGEITHRIIRQELQAKRDAFIRDLVDKAAVQVDDVQLQALAASGNKVETRSGTHGKPVLPKAPLLPETTQ